MAGVSASAGSTDPAADGQGHAWFRGPALFAVAPPRSCGRVRWRIRVAVPIEAGGTAILELRVDDRIGLFSRVSAVLESHGVDVRWAKVTTLGNTVVDVLCSAFRIRRTVSTTRFRAAVEGRYPGRLPACNRAIEPDSGHGHGTTGGTSAQVCRSAGEAADMEH